MEKIDQYEMIKKYPREWFPNRFFGFELGEGWFPILRDMFDEILQVEILESEKPFGFLQIKEKFGDLRVYSVGGNDKTQEIISRAEAKCSETCSKCGEKGIKQYDGWITVRCDEHSE